ncbi:endonuclease domain-containing protein [Magnetospirillum sp. UT-4]|uniref:endonuclease domain-containing protein n=1 Tax=Magnetospirillum sp. UT-4 TaxID=2681467 RepID=UPI0013855196|nr:endonuclease domain-containing protein [Magnetospirillum sp. UT-4]CAA7619373.1 ATP-dependent helicase HrpA [Magnetospirillum sp. UT-4]
MVTWKPHSATERARQLRQENATEAEKALWRRLQAKQLNGSKWRRQHPIGPYFADFVCHEYGLIVELDGGQHGLPDHQAHDRRRADYLESLGFKILRYWNNEVLENIEGVLETLAQALAGRPSPPTPLSRKRARGSTSTTEPNQ